MRAVVTDEVTSVLANLAPHAPYPTRLAAPRERADASATKTTVISRQMRRIALPAPGRAPAALPTTAASRGDNSHGSTGSLQAMASSIAAAVANDPQAAGGAGALAGLVLLAGFGVRHRRLSGGRPVAAVRVV